MGNGHETTSSASLAQRLESMWLEAARAGKTMPGEPTLASELTASRPAVREALARLEERGYIRRRQGADTVINRAVLDIPARIDEQVDQSELIAAMGRVPRLELVSSAVTAVTPEEVESFGVAVGMLALRTTKVWFADDVPVMVAVDSVPVRGASGALDGVDASSPVFALSTALGNAMVDWEIVWPGATALLPEQASLLELPVGAAVLTLDLIGVDRHGDTAYWASELHVNGAFRYAMIRSIRHAATTEGS